MEENLQLGISILTLLGLLFVAFRGFTEPNKKQDEEIAVSNATCELRHKNLDENIAKINSVLTLIQENDLKHIETRMTSLELGQVKIETILNERLPK
jgi:hypothetical protein